MSERPYRKLRILLIVLAWVVAGLCFVPWDVSLSRQMVNGLVPGDLRGLFHRAESFGHAYGALGVLVTIGVLDPCGWRKSIHPAVCFLVAGLTADLIKLQFWRIRPRAYFEFGVKGSTYLGSIWTTQSTDWASIFDNSRHSFPSAHTAGAVALAYSLGRLYPRGRGWFYVLAALCGMNRVDGGAHFASDVCWGAALGYLLVCLLPSADRMEAWMDAWQARRKQTQQADPPLSKAA